jgi:integrase
MARKASVRYWAGRGGYCCHFQGSQILLAKGPDDAPDGPTYAAARAKFNALVFGGPAAATLSDLAERFLRWARLHRSEGTVAIREAHLNSVCARFGDRAVAALTSLEIQEWLDGEQRRGRWGASTVRLVSVSLRTALSWGAKGGLIPLHPFVKGELPPEGSRGEEYALTPERIAIVLGACKGPTRQLLQALADTGARPGELCAAEARHYDPVLRALVFPANPWAGKQHKTARRTGKPRIVYLSGPTVATVERLVSLYPTGPLFRTARGAYKGPNRGQRRGFDQTSLGAIFRWLRHKTGVVPLCAYSFRHSFAVRWLRARKPVEALAEVLGTSVLMIQRHYGHLADQRDYLRQLVDEVSGEAPEVKG